MGLITGLTSKTPQNLLLGAGAFFKGYDVTKDTPVNAVAKLLGATQGGGSFNAVPTVRQIQVDGGKTNIKELETIDDWVVTMVANVKEVTAENLQLALGAAVAAQAESPAGYTKITGKEDFEGKDYQENITWIGTLKGSEKPVIIVLKNALSLNGLSLAVADKNEALVPITLTGHYSLDKLDEVPLGGYMRKIQTKDIFAAMRIVKKSGMKQQLIPLIEKAAGAEDVAQIGIEGFLTVMEVLSENNAERAMYEVLAGPFELTAGEVETLELDELASMLAELGEQNNLRNFFKALWGLITSKSFA